MDDPARIIRNGPWWLLAIAAVKYVVFHKWFGLHEDSSSTLPFRSIAVYGTIVLQQDVVRVLVVC